MAKIYFVEPIVEKVLKDNPATRADNFVLYVEVLKKFIDPKMSIESAFLNHRRLGIPSLETITRCRRKIQERNPDLKEDRATKAREEEEKEFREYSKEGK